MFRVRDSGVRARLSATTIVVVKLLLAPALCAVVLAIKPAAAW